MIRRRLHSNGIYWAFILDFQQKSSPGSRIIREGQVVPIGLRTALFKYLVRGKWTTLKDSLNTHLLRHLEPLSMEGWLTRWKALLVSCI